LELRKRAELEASESTIFGTRRDEEKIKDISL
jgi:hypothetical protein